MGAAMAVAVAVEAVAVEAMAVEAVVVAVEAENRRDMSRMNWVGGSQSVNLSRRPYGPLY